MTSERAVPVALRTAVTKLLYETDGTAEHLLEAAPSYGLVIRLAAARGEPGLDVELLARAMARQAYPDSEHQEAFAQGFRSMARGIVREYAALQTAMEDAASWLEAEADHPRADPLPAMRLQAGILRAAATPSPTRVAPLPPPNPSLIGTNYEATRLSALPVATPEPDQ